MRNRAIALCIAATLSAITAAGVTAQQPAAPAAPAYNREVPAALLSQTKIREDSARAIALARVPGGTVTALELEREHGHLIWSFDLTVAGKPGIEEVNVDAVTGHVVSVEHEKN
jgi:uncharacterized membrane protein YkoI